MSYLANISTSTPQKPYFIMIYGTPKIGKTEWAAKAPKSLFLDIEKGTERIKGIARLPEIQSPEEILTIVDELMKSNHEFKTFVVDSVDHLERMIIKKICSEAGEETLNAGKLSFGKGKNLLVSRTQEIIVKLSELSKKMNVICVAHSKLKTIENPMLEAGYHSYDLDLSEGTCELWKQHVEAILFASEQIHVSKTSMKDKVGKAIGQGQRILYTQGRPTHSAGNRFNLPPSLPLSYEDFAEAMESPANPQDIRSKIEVLAQEVDEKVRTNIQTALEKCGEDISQLNKLLNKVEVIVSKKQAA